MRVHFKLYISLALLLPWTHSINIATLPKSLRYLQSPVITASSSWNNSAPGNLPPNVSASFYGFDFAVTINRVFIGAPKLVNPSTPHLQPPSVQPNSEKGDIITCPTSSIFSQTSSSPCVSITPPNARPGDSFGMTISKAKNNRNLKVCAPAKQQKCGQFSFTPGYCYNSRNGGRTWRADGKTRETACPGENFDIMFVLDGSTSVGPRNFEKVKSWTKALASYFDLRSGKDRIGVVEYSHYYSNRSPSNQRLVKTVVRLARCRTAKCFNKSVDAVSLFNYTTYTAHALNKTVKDFQSSERFNQSTTSKILILLTDGKSSDPEFLPYSANYVRSLGITTFAVGVGNSVKEDELRTVATGDQTSNERVYKVENFTNLATIVDKLKTAILSISLEGGNNHTVSSYELQMAQTGFSSTRSQSGRLVLGTVGAYDWAGTLTIYSSTTDESPDIPDFEQVKSVLPNRTKESYLGYSVTTGFYNGPTVSEYIASGAPRYNLEGAVVVYRPESLNNNKNFTNSHTIRAHGDFKQLGSYFGGTLLTVDVNNDRHDDLLVGAPLYIGTSYYDEGRVFVYVTDASSPDNVARWASESYKPQELIGTMAGGRLGTAIASAGDLNDDGYNDVIVGAPLSDGDRGAVFVFHGSATGLDTTAKQIIRAKDLTATKLEYFGQSLQGGVDLDGNRYPDLAVGAPKSDTVVIFRTRPVVKFTSSLTFTKTSIDVLECFNTPNRQCVDVSACLSYTGKSVEETLEVNYNITLDKTRLEFRDQANSTNGQFDTSGVRTLTKDDPPSCWTIKVYVKQNIQDYSSLLTTSMTYDLTQAHKDLPLSSVRDPTIPNTVTATTEFSKSCGPDKVCRYDLKLDTTLILPSNVPSPDNDLSNNGQRLIIAPSTATTPIVVKVNLSNSGENAFDTRVIVTLSDPLSWTNVEDKSSSNSDFSNCIQDQGDVGNSSYKVLRYVHNTTLGSIMKQNDWCAFTIALSSSAFKASGAVGDMVVTILAETVSAGVQNDTNPGDNSWKAERQVRYRSDTDLTRVVIPDTALFNFTETNDTINSVEQIGNTSADMEYQYELKGLGFSNIPESNVILDFPSRLNENQHLLYPFEVGCTSDSRTTCVCNQTLVNPYNLTLPGAGVNDTGPNITMYANTVPFTQRTNFNCGSGGNNSNYCQAITCKLFNLDQQSIVLFTVKFRLWTKAYNFKDFNVSTFTSQLTLDTSPSKYIIFEDGSTSSVKSRNLKTQVEKYYPPEPEVKQPDLLWVYIVAAVAGLLLLLIIIAIMYKTGFFKSKYADMKQDQLEWNEANANGGGMEQQEEMLQS